MENICVHGLEGKQYHLQIKMAGFRRSNLETTATDAKDLVKKCLLYTDLDFVWKTRTKSMNLWCVCVRSAFLSDFPGPELLGVVVGMPISGKSHTTSSQELKALLLSLRIWFFCFLAQFALHSQVSYLRAVCQERDHC
jgi:hypothetical protein